MNFELYLLLPGHQVNAETRSLLSAVPFPSLYLYPSFFCSLFLQTISHSACYRGQSYLKFFDRNMSHSRDTVMYCGDLEVGHLFSLSMLEAFS